MGAEVIAIGSAIFFIILIIGCIGSQCCYKYNKIDEEIRG